MYWKVCPFLAKSMVHDDGASYGNIDTARMAKMTTFMYNERNWSQWLPLWRLIRFFYWHYSNNWVYLNKHIPQIDEGDIHKVACVAPAAAFSKFSLFDRGTHISSMENWMSLLKGACVCLTLLLNWVSLSICIDLSFSKEKKYKQNTSVIENFCPFWPNQWAVMMKLLLSQNKVSSSKQWYLDTLQSL